MKLAILSGPMKHETVPISRPELRIGRSNQADVTLAGDARISRVHCRLIESPDGYLVEDLGSANGTWLGERRLQAPTLLPPRTVIVVGETRVCIVHDDETTLPSIGPVPEIDDAIDVPRQLKVASTFDPRSLVLGDAASDTSELDTARRQLQVFQQVAEALVGKLDLEDALSTVARFLLTVVPAQRAVALRPTEDGKGFSPVAVCYSEKHDRQDTHLSGTLLARAARDKLAVLVQDTMEDSELRDRGSIKLGMIRSAICAPLLHEDEVKGLIQLDTSAAYSLDADDLMMVSAVANQAALAVANAELYEELRAAKTRLVRAEKLATLGELAESIAHDIGNVLTPIAGFSNRVGKSSDIKPELKDAFDRATRRLTSLTRQLLALGQPRAGTLKLVELDLNEAIRLSTDLLETEARHQKISIRTELDSALPRVTADGDRLDRVFVNLCLNAIHAMAERGGELLIRTRRDGDGVVASFADTGPGIPPQNLERVFEAFFTTKGDKGTGVGLHNCKRIVEEEHGGSLRVESEPGRGATFFVHLPVGPAPAPQHRP